MTFTMSNRNIHSKIAYGLFAIMALLSSCARMGAPDGGWFDETPPRVTGAIPADRDTNVTAKKISIYFDEYIKLENASEKVVISPPQKEQPEIKATGRRIQIELIDSLKPNTTYTVDFSDAIVDNNESNPMGNYTYSFSTGNVIDTMECSGYVLNAEDLEPVKGILVGLTRLQTDSNAVKSMTEPFLRVSRTDSRGYFVIRGIAPGTYNVGALQDIDGDFCFSQRAEVMAFSHQDITPSSFLDHRQDTVWLDELRIKDIKRVPYTHFTPDNIVLRSFLHEQTERHFLKYERKDADRFTLFFTAPVSADSLERFNDMGTKPRLRLLGMDAPTDSMLLCEHSLRADTLTYWLRDTMLVNRDTLMLEMTTLQTDTAGMLQITCDTLEILAKTTLAKRMKQAANEYNEWRKDIDKKIKEREKRITRLRQEGETDINIPEIDTIMPPERLKPTYDLKQSIDPVGVIKVSFPYPMRKVDTTAVHLYVEQDSLWFRAPMVMQPTDSMPTRRNWVIYTDWIPGAKYSFEIDTLAFEDIYGHTSEPYKTGIMVRKMEDFASLFVNVTHNTTPDEKVIVQLLGGNGNVARTATVQQGTAEFYYVEQGTFYLRAFVDRNDNGQWDTGDYYNDRQPEEVYYFPEKIECKAKWDYTKQWNLTATPLYRQKPAEITRQKADKAKTIKHRNAERAKDKGIRWPIEGI